MIGHQRALGRSHFIVIPSAWRWRTSLHEDRPLRRLAPLALLGMLAFVPTAHAQNRVVTSCGSTSPFASPSAGSQSPLFLDTNGNVCTNAGGGGGGGTSSNFNATFPTAGTAAGAEYLSSPPTYTTGQMVPLQTDASGNLLVNIKAGAGSGGTAITDNTAFTQSTTSETPMGCLFITSYVAATSGRSTIPQCDSTGHQLMAIASGGVASGAFASGSIASGALAAGSISSGAAVSGAFATGAIADLALAQGSATSGQKGNLVLGAASTALPTATTADSWPLSIVPASGGVRMDTASVAGTATVTAASGVQKVGVVGNAGAAFDKTALGAASTNSVQIEGVASGTAVPVSSTTLSTAANQATEITSLATIATNTGASVPAGSNLIGQIDILGNAGAVMDFAGQNATTPANALLVGAQFNTTPTTLTTGHTSALQMDNAGNLLVNIKAGAGSGGTALTDNSAFTQSTTSETPMGCLYITSYVSATTGHSTIPQCSIKGHLQVDVNAAGGNSFTSTQGQAIPVAGAMFGISDGTNLQFWNAVHVGTNYFGGIDKSSVDGTALGAVVSNLGTLASGTPAAENENVYIVGCTTGGSPCNANGVGAVGASSPVVQPLSASATLQSSAVASGNGTPFTVAGYQGADVYVNCSVACSGGTTITFQVSLDNTTYFSVQGVPLAGGVPTTTATTTGEFRINVAGWSYLRTPISGYSAGTITVTAFGDSGSWFQPYQATVVGTGTFATQSAITAASGSIASGAIASGALAAGSISSGAAVSGAFATGAIADLALAQGSTTSGQKGNLVLGAASTALPTATTADSWPLSILPATGGVRTDMSSVGGFSFGANTNPPAVAVSSAPTTAGNQALVVDLRPDSPGIIALGAAASASSVPMVPATDYGGPVNITPTNCSVTLTTGGSAQNAFTAGATKHGFTIQNIDTAHGSEAVWFSMTTTAAAASVQSYYLAVYDKWTSPPNLGINTALSVIAATTGHLISCTYW